MAMNIEVKNIIMSDHGVDIVETMLQFPEVLRDNLIWEKIFVA